MARSFKIVLMSFCLGLLGVATYLLPWTWDLEQDVGLHLLFLMRGERAAPRQVVVISIDRQSAESFNLPLEPVKWPRSLHARLVQRLKELGAATIAFDIIFSEPQSAEDDRMFANAIREADNVILAQTLSRKNMGLFDKLGTPSGNVTIESVIAPIALLGEAAAGQAPFPLPKVPIKLSRYWLFKPEAGDVPTLPVVVLQHYAGAAFPALVKLIRSIQSEHPAVKSFLVEAEGTGRNMGAQHLADALWTLFQKVPRLGQDINRQLALSPPADFDSRTLGLIKAMLFVYGGKSNRYFDFYGPPGSIETISYNSVMTSPEDAVELDFTAKAVFIGQTESAWPKVQDGFYNVYARNKGIDISGVEVAATAFANLFESRSVTPLETPVHLGLVFAWGMIIALLCFFLPAVFSSISIVGVGGLYLYYTHVQFKSAALWYPLVVPVFFLLPTAYVAALAWKYREAARERQNIRKAFGYFLPDDVVDQLSRNIKQVHALGQTVYGVCLMTDAARYTTVSESLNPEDLKHLMNDYYEAVFTPIKANGGVIVQVVGDSVLTLWTAREADHKLAAKACDAALAVIDAVERFNTERPQFALPTRIGMNAGYMVWGNIGAVDHFEYRPVGDIVNTAARLEGLNKFLETQVLVSGEIAAGLDGFLTRYIGRFLFIGKATPTEVFELKRKEELCEKRNNICVRFASGVSDFQRGAWDNASEAFQEVLAADDADGPALFYLRQCDQYKVCAVAAEWDGTIRLNRK